MAASKESPGRARVQRPAAVNKTVASAKAESHELPDAVPPSAGTTFASSAAFTGPSDKISRLILDTVSEGIYCLDMDGQTTFINPAAARMTGRDPEECLGRSQHEMVHHSYADGSTYPREVCPVFRTLRDGKTHHCENEVFWRADGTCFPVSYTSTPILVDGVLTGTVVNFQDISERIRRDHWQTSKNSVLRGISSHRPLRDTLQALADAFTDFDSSCSIAFLLRHDAVPDNLFLVAGSRLPEILETNLKLLSIDHGLSACGEAASTGREVFVDVNHSTGAGSKYAELSVTHMELCLALPLLSAEGSVRGVVALFLSTPAAQSKLPFSTPAPIDQIDDALYRTVRDIAQIAIETQKLHLSLIHQTEHDHLTDLPNRLLFEVRLNQAIRDSNLDHSRLAICLIDLDRFRRVNENFGHLVGDGLLQQIANRLQRSMRAIDTIARESGDEFLFLLPELASAEDAELICRRLLLAMASPFVIEGHSIVVSANIGICLYPDHAATPEMLIQHAETAVDYAKAKGQGKLQLFRPDLGERVRQLAAREAALGTALERNELYLMYQPLYDADRHIHGFEALLRWNNPYLGLIPPDEFIPLAESTGLIIPIGVWVLNEACRQAVAWKANALKDTKIFVNVSALQLGQVDFTHTVSEALRVSGLSPSRLELEVTESLIVPSFTKATARLQPLQNLGVSIAIDDFGTGHSSFGVLHKLPINAIKVDRSFVSRIDSDPSGLSTVRAIVDLARQLGMKTVGEGVETEEQFRLLQEMRCDYFQGYLLSRPLTPEAAHLLFENARPLRSRASEKFRISA